MKIHRSKVAFAQKVIDSSSEGIPQTMIQVGLGLKLHGLTTMVSVCSSVQLKSAQSKDLNLHPRLYNRGLLRRQINERWAICRREKKSPRESSTSGGKTRMVANAESRRQDLKRSLRINSVLIRVAKRRKSTIIEISTIPISLPQTLALLFRSD